MKMKITDKIKNYFLQKWTGYTFEQLYALEAAKSYTVAEYHKPILLQCKKVVEWKGTLYYEQYVEENIRQELGEEAAKHVKLTEEINSKDNIKTLIGTLIISE